MAVWRGVRWTVPVLVPILVPILAVCGAGAAFAQSAATPAIRIWGHGHRGQDYILTLLHAWEQGYRAEHPEARFEEHLFGDASGIGALFTGVGDLAILDRQASFIEVDAYQQGAGHDPFGIPVAMGSVGTPRHAPAVKVYVNRANPLNELTLQQLDAIFDADHRRGDRSVSTWGELGLTGEWAAHRIDAYSPFLESAEMQFFERAALKGSQKFSCCLTVFSPRAGATPEEQAAAALARDRYGIALSTRPEPGLKALKLAAADGPAVAATAESVAAGGYPLARTVYVYANRGPKQPLAPQVAEFLAYVVSPEGQAVVARTGGYLPLSPALAAQAKEALR